MKQPMIGITGNLFVVDNAQNFNGMMRSFCNQDYIDFVINSHAVPVVLPSAERYDTTMVEDMVSRMDGILLSGGYDITPSLYGEPAQEHQDYSMSCIDEFYMEVIRCAELFHKPVFAICKGLQALNAAYGGTLYQDLSSQKEGVLQHRQKARRQDAVHKITVERNSFLGSCLTEPEIWVNSHHHQAIKVLAPGFRITALSPDGVIEGIEKADGAPIIGVQWHPEMMAVNGNETQQQLFTKFLETFL